MGIFSRMKRAIKSKTNAAIDRAIDPQKELDMLILDLEEQRKTALKELLSYKTTAKQMEQEMAKYEEKAETWEKRAMVAVKASDDELATKCLKEHRMAKTEVGKIRSDRDEAAGYAIELNRSRKLVETRLKILKLKKGTMANQLAAARGKNVFDTEDLMGRFEAAEEAIDDEAIAAEVQAAMEGEDEGTAELESQLMDAAEHGGAEDELKQLKAKMAEQKKHKLLAKADISSDSESDPSSPSDPTSPTDSDSASDTDDK